MPKQEDKNLRTESGLYKSKKEHSEKYDKEKVDNIVNNDVQKHFKKVIKKVRPDGEVYKYTEHSSEFWPYRLVQIISKLPDTYKNDFMERYDIAEDKLNAVLSAIDRAPNQRLYKYLKNCLAELKTAYEG